MKDEVELHGRDGHATANAPVSCGTGVPPVKIWPVILPCLCVKLVPMRRCRGLWNYSLVAIC